MHDADAKLARINFGLSLVIVIIWLYVIVTPYLPQFYFWIDHFAGQQDQLTRSLQTPAASLEPANTNQLIAPRMLLAAPIQDSKDPATLSTHIWRLPASSTPDKGGNTVLISSRFSYNHPRGLFYFLDKMRPGDTFAVVWAGKTYRYRVTASTILSGSSRLPFENSEQPSVTLYSTTPLWFQAQRLAVTGQLVGSP